MKFKRLVPLALALAIASTTAVEARTSAAEPLFVRRASELHADGQPSFCEQFLAEHCREQQLHRAGRSLW